MPEQKKKIGRPANGATQILGISITPELKKQIMAKARSERRSASSLVCSFLEASFNDNPKATEPAPETHVKPNHPQVGRRISESGATAMLTISLQPELKDAVKAIAKLEHRTASNMACVMLHDWIAQWQKDHPGETLGAVQAEAK